MARADTWERTVECIEERLALDEKPQSLSVVDVSDATREAPPLKGLGDAPWPPHYEKKGGEPPRVQPSRSRASKKPLIEIGRAKHEADALAGLERWKKRHARAAAHLEPADVLVDRMRGRSTTWTRIRINLQNVPAELRPAQEPLDPNENTFPSS